MLTIIIPERELFDEGTNQIIKLKEQKLTMEHSLLSISKWESKYCKPFLTDDPKTGDEVLYYFKCMTITPVPDMYYNLLTNQNVKDIEDYIASPMTATVIKDKGPKKHSREILTSEVIYYYMSALQIPFECDRWHLNRLMTLIGVCSIKNSPDKKMSKRDILNNNAALNAARKKQLHTRG